MRFHATYPVPTGRFGLQLGSRLTLDLGFASTVSLARHCSAFHYLQHWRTLPSITAGVKRHMLRPLRVFSISILGMSLALPVTRSQAVAPTDFEVATIKLSKDPTGNSSGIRTGRGELNGITRVPSDEHATLDALRTRKVLVTSIA